MATTTFPGVLGLAALRPLTSTGLQVRRLADNVEYVIKTVRIGELKRSEQEAAINEVKLMAKMDHTHVVRYFEAFIEVLDLSSLAAALAYHPPVTLPTPHIP